MFKIINLKTTGFVKNLSKHIKKLCVEKKKSC